MESEIFGFEPAAVPRAERALRRSKYVATVEAIHAYLEDHKDQRSVKIDLGEVSIKTAVTGFRGAIARQFPGALRLLQRGGHLYIEKL